MREGLLFTVASTVCQIFAAKLRNSATRAENAEWRNYLASATLRNAVNTRAKPRS
jgi:hypothetical protein